jgi:hypothetical protein
MPPDDLEGDPVADSQFVHLLADGRDPARSFMAENGGHWNRVPPSMGPVVDRDVGRADSCPLDVDDHLTNPWHWMRPILP